MNKEEIAKKIKVAEEQKKVDTLLHDEENTHKQTHH